MIIQDILPKNRNQLRGKPLCQYEKEIQQMSVNKKGNHTSKTIF